MLSLMSSSLNFPVSQALFNYKKTTLSEDSASVLDVKEREMLNKDVIQEKVRFRNSFTFQRS